jgi:diguanylate cyclase (GGDEF)-like protein/PAS domain S-box-containing protein
LDRGVIASLLQHPLPSAVLVLDTDGEPLAGNAVAHALGLMEAARAYAAVLADQRVLLSRPNIDEIACSLPGPAGRLDGVLRTVVGQEGELLAYTLTVPEPNGASRWQVALDSAGHGLWDWDLPSNALYRSENWRAMLGYPADEPNGRGLDNILSLVHPDDIEHVRDSVRAHLSGHSEVYRCEHRVRGHDGGWHWVRDSGRVVAHTPDGRPLRMVGTHTDISEQKQLEQHLTEQRTLLRETQRIAGMASWVWDPGSDASWWSEELHEMTGVAGDQAPNGRRWAQALTMASRGVLRRAWRRMKRTAENTHFDLEAARADGAPLHLRVWAKPELNEIGGIDRVLGKVQDVTEERRTGTLMRWRTELLNRVSALGGIGGCEIDVATRRVQWTEECQRLHGLPDGSTSLDEALAQYTHDSRDAFEAALVRLTDGGPAERLDMCFYRPNGKRIWVEVQVDLDLREGLPSRFVALFRDITRERETHERIELLSHYDLLTGLPNRFLLRAQAEEAIATALDADAPLALLVIDLNGFKGINDSFGHAAGDVLLKAAAGRVHRCLQSNHLLGRLGGDEFLVVLPHPASQELAALVASQLIEALIEPLQLGNDLLKIGTSIGISLLGPELKDFDALLRAGYAAVYSAREKGGNTFAFHTQEVVRTTRRRLELEQALRGAVEREEFSLVYQPVVASKGDHPPGVEALLRWHRPGIGYCSPVDFIPVAEGCGEIVRIGDWVLSEACRQAAAWEKAGLSFSRISVNISAVQLRDPGFAERAVALCRRAGWTPDRLELELTESVLILESDALRSCFQTLEAHGVLLAIDDFGTGFSNLRYLNRFPVQRLKIDRSFVSDLLTDHNTSKVTQAIIHLGHALGMRVVAEGAEQPEQCAWLHEQGCDEVQGYFYTRPLPPREMAQWLRSERD